MDDKRITNQFYECFWSDARYQYTYAFDSAVRDRFPAIKKVWGDLRLPGRVLDYGCGNGVLTFWLWSNGFGRQITGVDVSCTGIATARQIFARPGLFFETLEQFERQPSGDFDVVVSSHVLEHIEKPEIALGQMGAKAEWLILEVPLEKCLWPDIAARIRKRPRSDNPLGHVNFWNKATFKSFLKSANLLIVREYQYASAPYSPFSHRAKRWIERAALKVLGIRFYGVLMATHYIVLARKIDV